MYHIEETDAVAVMPMIKPASTTDRQYFQSGNPRAGKKATIVTEDWLNIIQEELLNVLAAAEITPDKMDLNQLALAISTIAGTAAETTINNYVGEGGSQIFGGGGLVYPSATALVFEQTPPENWRVRNGAIIDNASQTVPELYQYLLQPANVWKCVSAADWQTKSNNAGGIGGVPYYVLDQIMNTIRLPDTRGDYERAALGGTMANVGDWHGDAIRNITATFEADEFAKNSATTSGAFYVTIGNHAGPTGSRGGSYRLHFDASRVVPTAAENRTRAFGMLPIVYVGAPTPTE